MSNESENTNKLPTDDWTTDVPNLPEAPKGVWKMPEPTFRVSEGITVGGSSERKTPPANSPPNQSAKPTEAKTTEKSASDVKIQAQPYISEEFNINQIKTPPDTQPKPKSKIPRIIFAVAGIAVMAAFAVAFLIGVYFLFFYKPPE